jgi:hypothetical protein
MYFMWWNTKWAAGCDLKRPFWRIFNCCPPKCSWLVYWWSSEVDLIGQQCSLTNLSRSFARRSYCWVHGGVEFERVPDSPPLGLDEILGASSFSLLLPLQPLCAWRAPPKAILFCASRFMRHFLFRFFVRFLIVEAQVESSRRINLSRPDTRSFSSVKVCCCSLTRIQF